MFCACVENSLWPKSFEYSFDHIAPPWWILQSSVFCLFVCLFILSEAKEKIFQSLFIFIDQVNKTREDQKPEGEQERRKQRTQERFFLFAFSPPNKIILSLSSPELPLFVCLFLLLFSYVCGVPCITSICWDNHWYFPTSELALSGCKRPLRDLTSPCFPPLIFRTKGVAKGRPECRVRPPPPSPRSFSAGFRSSTYVRLWGLVVVDPVLGNGNWMLGSTLDGGPMSSQYLS